MLSVCFGHSDCLLCSRITVSEGSVSARFRVATLASLITTKAGANMYVVNNSSARRVPWNKGKLVGQKAPLKQREIWAIRVRLQLQEDVRELALFNLVIDSKLRSCDLVRLHVRDVCPGGRVSSRAIVMQRKTQRPVQFEITE